MTNQVFVVVTYRDGHQHVMPLYPAELTLQSALDLARQAAEEHGKRGSHAVDGDRIDFAAVEAADSLMAVNIASHVAKRRLVHGSFTL